MPIFTLDIARDQEEITHIKEADREESESYKDFSEVSWTMCREISQKLSIYILG